MTLESWIVAAVLGWAGWVTVFPLVLSYTASLHRKMAEAQDRLRRIEIDELRARVRILESRESSLFWDEPRE